MKTSQKIKRWARIGQIAGWLYVLFVTQYEAQLPTRLEAPVSSGTDTEDILVIVIFILAILFTEAIVRVIGYFAELLDK